eukprot:scaffold7989_cov403-Prasinococcus_capsulatus_cf.AAC.8
MAARAAPSGSSTARWRRKCAPECVSVCSARRHAPPSLRPRAPAAQIRLPLSEPRGLASLHPCPKDLLVHKTRTRVYSCSSDDDLGAPSQQDTWLEVAAITGAHGVRGAMRLKVMTDFPAERLERADKVWLKEKGTREPREVRLLRTVKVSGKRPGYLAMMEGITTPEDVLGLRGATFVVRSSDRPELEEDEYLSHDLIGMRVVSMAAEGSGLEKGDSTAEALRPETSPEQHTGTVVDVQSVGPTDLLEVELSAEINAEQNTPMGCTVLIPFVEQIVREVSWHAQRTHRPCFQVERA